MDEKRKRQCYSIKFKLEVISYTKTHGNRAAARNFGPNEKLVRYWRRQEETLRAVVGKRKKTSLRRGTVKWPELEEELKEWVVNNRNSGHCVSTKMIMHHSRELARTRGVNGFRGSTSWCQKFMRRNGLSMRARTTLSQKMPAEYEHKIMEFHRFIIRARQNVEFELSQIGNMDEVPLTFDVPSNKTVDIKGTKSITVKTSGNEKTHYTVVLACIYLPSGT